MSLCALASKKSFKVYSIVQIRVFPDHGKKTNATRDGEKGGRGLTEEVWGRKVKGGRKVGRKVGRRVGSQVKRTDS